MIPTKKQCIEQNISNKRIKQKMAKLMQVEIVGLYSLREI